MKKKKAIKKKMMLNSDCKYFWICNFRHFTFCFGGTNLKTPDPCDAILTIILTKPSGWKKGPHKKVKEWIREIL